MSPSRALTCLALLLSSCALARAQEEAIALMLKARAMQLRAGGKDSKSSAEMYRKVIALVPRSAEAHLRLSEALVESRDIDEAVAPAIRATELAPRNGEAWAHLGLLQMHRSQTKPELLPMVRKALRMATRLIPNDAELLFRLAGVYEAQKDKPQALKTWLRLARLNPQGKIGSGQPLAMYAWERTLELATELDLYEPRREAIMTLSERRCQPDDFQALEKLTREQVSKGYLGHAEESFLLLGKFFPNEPALWESITIMQLHTNRYEEGLRSLLHAESLRKTARITLNIGICQMNLGRLSEAESRFRDLLADTTVPESDKSMQEGARTLLAICLLLEGRPQDTLNLVNSCPDADKQLDLLAIKAQAFIQLKDWKAARATLLDGIQRFPKRSIFKEAAALPPETLDGKRSEKTKALRALNGLNLESMASLWAEFRQWDKCLLLIRDAHKVMPSRSVDLLLLESNALEQLGKPAEAETVLREAQKVAPTNATLQNNLGYNLLERGVHLDEAASLIEAANRLEPDNGSFVDSLGWVQFKQGKFAEAETTLRKALELNANSPELLKHYGEVLLKLDRPEEALAQWERAMAYVFSNRNELEKRIRDLRVVLAKREAALDAEDALPPEDPELEDPEFESED